MSGLRQTEPEPLGWKTSKARSDVLIVCVVICSQQDLSLRLLYKYSTNKSTAQQQFKFYFLLS